MSALKLFVRNVIQRLLKDPRIKWYVDRFAKKKTSILVKLIYLLLINALFVLIIGVFSIVNLTIMLGMSESAYKNNVPYLKISEVVKMNLKQQQLYFERLASASSINELNQLMESHQREGMRFRTFVKVLVWGSESRIFRSLESGAYYKVWKQLDYQNEIIVRDPWEDVGRQAGQVDIYYQSYVEKLDEFYLAGKKLFRNKDQGSAPAEIRENVEELATKYQEAKVYRKYAEEKIRDMMALLDKRLQVSIEEAKSQNERTRTLLTVIIIGCLFFSFGVGIWFARRNFIKPLNSLAIEMLKVQEGDYSKPKIKLKTHDEIEELADTYTQMVVALGQAKKKILQQSEEIQQAMAQEQVALLAKNEALVREQEAMQQVQEVLQRELNLRDIQLEQTQKLADIGEMSAGLIHEMKQPLNFMKIMAQGIKRSLTKGRYTIAELPNDMSEIEKLVDRLADHINQMRKFSRKSDRTTRGPISVNQAVEEVVKMIGEQLRMHQITTELQIDPDLRQIIGSYNRLEQVMINLITNARDAMDEHYPDNPENKKLVIRTRNQDEWVVIEVEDTGGGIPEEYRDRLFDQFFTTKDAEKGTGLGLGIVKSIVEDYNGMISFDSTLGVGTVFMVCFPGMVADASEMPARES